MEAVFSCENLVKRYREKELFGGLSLTLEKGKIYGLVGEAGAGKSTLLRLMTGLSFADGGEMELLGERRPRGWRRARQRMGALVGEGIFVPALTGRKNLEMACKAKGRRRQREDCAALLEAVGLAQKADLPVRVYTGEEKGLLGIAMALAGKPELAVLDEPFLTLEAEQLPKIKELLRARCREEGVTFLVAVPALPVLEGLADRCLFLHRGKLLEELDWKDVDRRCDGYLCLEVETAAEKAAEILVAAYPQITVETEGEELRLRGYHGNPQRFQGLLAKQSIAVKRMEPVGLTLENYLGHLAERQGER